ncbi:MAG: dihydrodipicolinate reductase C-terminal domain-containing protein [Flavobacteriales bacterium]
MKHQANNRDGFALGSILAAKWLVDQESGVYSMRDFLKIK